MLQNAYLIAKVGADTAENERNVAENSPKFATRDAERGEPAREAEVDDLQRRLHDVLLIREQEVLRLEVPVRDEVVVHVVPMFF